MARAIAWDLRACEPRYPLLVIDRDPAALKGLVDFVGGEGVRTLAQDAGDVDFIRRLMSRAALCIGALSYRMNCDHAGVAVSEGAHWVDLGGNTQVVRSQFELDGEARRAGVAVVPDCGLAPGMVNVIAGDAAARLDEMEELRVRVGGLPQHPRPPLFYGLVFSPEGLANEYSQPALVIERGGVREVAPLTCREMVDVGPPFGVLEAFHTSGGSSTMVESFKGRVRELDCKTLRYPGHLERIRLLYELGLFDADEVELDTGLKVAPRRLLGALLERMGWVREDIVVVKLWAVGRRGGKGMRVEYSLLDRFDPASGLTAMARTTGFSAAVIARMILDGRIPARGVLRQEQSVPPDHFLRELAGRGIKVNVREVEL